MPRRTRSRIEQLRRHNHRTRWRDAQAVEAYYTLLSAQKLAPTSVNLGVFDKFLKEYYTPDLIKTFSMEQNSAFKFLSLKFRNTLYGGED